MSIARSGVATPRYLFNIRGPVDVCDTPGIELPDLEAAQTHAFRLYATATGDDFMSPCQEWRMEVTDSVGTILFRLDLTSAAQSVGFN